MAQFLADQIDISESNYGRGPLPPETKVIAVQDLASVSVDYAACVMSIAAELLRMQNGFDWAKWISYKICCPWADPLAGIKSPEELDALIMDGKIFRSIANLAKQEAKNGR